MGEETLEQRDYKGIPNVSARPRINLPGRSDRVVKHSHHVSFALNTKFSHAFTHRHCLSPHKHIRTARVYTLSRSRIHARIHTFLTPRLRLNTIVNYKYVQLTSSYCEGDDGAVYEVISRIPREFLITPPPLPTSTLCSQQYNYTYTRVVRYYRYSQMKRNGFISAKTINVSR